MFETGSDPRTLRPQELEAVYAISRAVAQADNVERALDEIIRLSRSVLIFDNMVVYLQQADRSLEPAFARIIGRGRTAEADLSWGENIALDVVKMGQTLLYQEKLAEWETDRLAWRIFLGLPLCFRDESTGALVFGRFGGPTFTPDQINLAEFVASHVAQLLDRQSLVQRIASLEADRRLGLLQADFIAMVSHELCTPLGFIKGYATTLLREDTSWDDATRREFLQVIDDEADRLRELIDNLLDSSRLQAGTLHMEFQPVRLDPLLKDVTARARARYPTLAVKLDFKATPTVQGDPTRIAQVFENLLTNAVKYAPDAPVEMVLGVAGSDRAQVTVSDQGPGIAPEHLSHLFERFYRVPDRNPSVRGTGLGLFICHQIVQAHHGEIAVESAPGHGTTFHIYLPLHKA
jgi:signal transduction histidine kinase